MKRSWWLVAAMVGLMITSSVQAGGGKGLYGGGKSGGSGGNNGNSHNFTPRTISGNSGGRHSSSNGNGGGSSFKPPKITGIGGSSSNSGIVPRVQQTPRFDPKVTMPKFDPKFSMPHNVGQGKPEIKKPIEGIRLPGNLGNIVNSNQGSHHNGSPSNGNSKVGIPKFDKMPGLQVNDLVKSKVHVDKSFDMKKAASFAPKSYSCNPHFDWWLIALNHHHCHHHGHWDYHHYHWDHWRPCTYTTIVYQQRSYFVGMTCVFIPDMQAYGVQSVAANSPAELSGVKVGDLILSINGRSIADDSVLKNEMSRGRLDMELVRDGEAGGMKATIFPRLLTTVSY